MVLLTMVLGGVFADGFLGEIQGIEIYPTTWGKEVCIVKMLNDTRKWAFELGSITSGIIVAKLIKAHEQNTIVQNMAPDFKLFYSVHEPDSNEI